MDQIDVERAFKAPFQDKNWVSRTLFGWLWLLLGVTSPAVVGAELDYIRGVSQGHEELPDWNDFGSKWVRGLLVCLAGFIYSLPIVVLGFIVLVPVVVAVVSGSESMAGLAGGGVCLFWLIAIIYGTAVSVLFSAATVNFALKGDFGSFFQVGQILERVRSGSGYFVAWLWTIAVSIAGSIVTSILAATVVGYIAIPAVAYVMIMITGHLFGQWAAKSYNLVADATTPGWTPPAPPTIG